MLTGVWSRVIPTLLLSNRTLVKTVQFKKPIYVGDPINAVKIFNEKEVDELILLDINASQSGKPPDFEFLSRISREAFMPMAYGGGIASTDDAKKVLRLGFEKVIINSAALQNPKLIKQISDMHGSQSVVVSIDVAGKDQHIYIHKTMKRSEIRVLDFVKQIEAEGAGEIMLTSVDRDGTFQGYNLNLIKTVASAVKIPVIACGGAASVRDLEQAVLDAGASAAAGGSMFVFYGKSNSVLISYPSREELQRVASGRL